MQRMAACLVIAGAIALASGCKEKDEGMAMGPAQSVDYQNPSTSYYAPDASNEGGNDGFTYYDGGQSTTTAAPASASGSTHTVAKGDTLYSLARAYYNGDMSKWKVIYEANRDRISSPDVLKVGQQIVIP